MNDTEHIDDDKFAPVKEELERWYEKNYCNEPLECTLIIFYEMLSIISLVNTSKIEKKSLDYITFNAQFICSFIFVRFDLLSYQNIEQSQKNANKHLHFIGNHT